MPANRSYGSHWSYEFYLSGNLPRPFRRQNPLKRTENGTFANLPIEIGLDQC